MPERFLQRVLRIKNYGDVRTRQRAGKIAGCVGVCINILLFIAKLLIGTASGAVSIIADAFNNLSDAGTSIVMIFGFHLSTRPADDNHPFGYGRTEYLAGFIVAAAILAAGLDLFHRSLGVFMAPEPLEVSSLTIVVLALSIEAKLLLAYFYRFIGKKIDSAAVRAASADSLSDGVATLVVLAAMVVYEYFSVNADGIAGMLVACFILYSGWCALKDTIQPLMGDAPDPELLDSIRRITTEETDVLGVHDLIVHDYGPGRRFLSMDVEMPASMTLIEAHERIDRLEKLLMAEFHIRVTLHLDPVVTDDPERDRLFVLSSRILSSLDERLALHDFRVVPYRNGRKLIFEVKAPQGFSKSDRELKKEFQRRLMAVEPENRAVMRVDRQYC